MSLFGMDLDELFAYQTPKIVVLKDRWLGLFRLSLMLIIVSYIFIYMILYRGEHLAVGDVDGVFRLSLRHPTMHSCDPDDIGCRSNYTSFDTLSYCKQNPDEYRSVDDGLVQQKGNCQFWDSVEATMNVDQGLMLPTRVRRFDQIRGCIPSADNDWNCDGAPYEFLDGSNIQTKPGKPKPYVDAFIADIEDFTLLIDHQFRKYGGMQADDFQMNGWWHECPDSKSRGSECTSRQIKCAHGQCPDGAPRVSAATPSGTAFLQGQRVEAADESLPGGEPVVGARKGDVFLVSTLLHAGNLDLDTTAGLEGLDQTLRHRGMVLVVHIEYYNKPSGGWMGFKITPWSTPDPYYTYHISSREAYDYTITKTFNDPADTKRTVRVFNGIRIVLEQSGRIMEWSTAQFLVTMTAALGLLAVATTITELAMTTVMKKADEYKKRKYHNSCDFSTEERKKAETLEEAGQNFLEAFDTQDGREMAKAVKELMEVWEKDPEAARS